MTNYIISFVHTKPRHFDSLLWKLRPADLRREPTKVVSCDLHTFLQITNVSRKGLGGCRFTSEPLDGTVGPRKSPPRLILAGRRPSSYFTLNSPPGSMGENVFFSLLLAPLFKGEIVA